VSLQRMMFVVSDLAVCFHLACAVAVADASASSQWRDINLWFDPADVPPDPLLSCSDPLTIIVRVYRKRSHTHLRSSLQYSPIHVRFLPRQDSNTPTHPEAIYPTHTVQVFLSTVSVIRSRFAFDKSRWFREQRLQNELRYDRLRSLQSEEKF
jgi:hypothetical protein